MTRVLVVGVDVDTERILLERLHRIAGLPVGSLQACRDLDECELLIVRNSPGLRNAALRMRQTRPQMHLWVEANDGALLNGTDDALPALSNEQIVSVLTASNVSVARPLAPSLAVAAAGPRPQAVVPASRTATTEKPRAALELVKNNRVFADVPDTRGKPVLAAKPAAQGRDELIEALRSGIQQRRGHVLLLAAEKPVLALDFSSAQAVPLLSAMQNGLAEAAQWLGEALPQLRIQPISAESYLGHEQQGQRLPLRALLWQAAQLVGGWDRIDAQLEQGAVIHLQGWPDFRVLARQQDVFRLCSLLVRKPSSQADCVHLLDLSPNTVKTFVHGAFLSGYVRLDEVSSSAFEQLKQDMRTVPAPPRGGLLARMWRSVRSAAVGG